VILSRQQRQIDRLIEENAIMAAELRDLRWSLDVTSGRRATDRPRDGLANPGSTGVLEK
jgi:hypothetical protein